MGTNVCTHCKTYKHSKPTALIKQRKREKKPSLLLCLQFEWVQIETSNILSNRWKYNQTIDFDSLIFFFEVAIVHVLNSWNSNEMNIIEMKTSAIVRKNDFTDIISKFVILLKFEIAIGGIIFIIIHWWVERKQMVTSLTSCSMFKELNRFYTSWIDRKYYAHSDYDRNLLIAYWTVSLSLSLTLLNFISFHFMLIALQHTINIAFNSIQFCRVQ